MKVGLQIGFDRDDDQPQLRHVCWPYQMWWGALCKTPRLWFQGDIAGAGHRFDGSIVDDEFTCPECLLELPKLMQRDPELLDGIGRLAATVASLRVIHHAAREFRWLLDHPEEYERVQAEREKSLITVLDEALRSESDRWKALVEKGNPSR